MLDFLNEAHRAEGAVAKLETRLVAQRADGAVARHTHNAALLADEEDGTKSADATLKILRVAEDAVARTEGALVAAQDRLAAIRRGDDDSMSKKAQAARAEMRKGLDGLCTQREAAANSLKVALNQYATARTRLVELSARIISAGAELGLTFEPFGAALMQATVDARIDHEIGALDLPHGAVHNDPSAPRPTLAAYIAGASTVIRQAAGINRG